ncbi:4-(cytidine 5'-diphospho)-2-C-methyl-D-erythritol kinase [Alkaliphilus serpentinus]|uniref:4-diphosphocytidyl-2-C-methyl-D-erythritol kinase n=1 Tax=Alkaliphilus serpentinus TaxID=1482731 RepID=A0A833HQZ8_9FIRM|nr:4-(cytidine 5'-diphospho)-2-C-methyl-D-erythritol kinase [Alkaliphilus serpentinus]KAB3532486.1 4-(cytidine 5'-diphospho)-2-C-methyl-D-erythritol kinase [Alkaliphilus serpentinus]
MKNIHLKARAKINLSLDVLNKRPDGYHEVEMIMQQINLYDEIRLFERDVNEIRILTGCKFIPTNATNIAYKAAELMKESYSIDKGVDIYIKKNIPVAAGLAGGSTNAASVINGLNRMWRLGLSLKERMDLGIKIGADVPFCIMGGAALAEGIGERLTPINSLKNVWFLVSKPSISVSTADVYSQLELTKIMERPDNKLLLTAMEKEDIVTISKNMKNVLETVTETKYNDIKNIKRKMIEYNALGSMMSGSGPTVFGIFKNHKRGKAAYNNLSKLYKQTFLVQSYYGRNEDEQSTEFKDRKL